MIRVPVLVLAGGLGVGKTTRLNQFLTAAHAHGSRVAVIENEFGEVGIDAELLAAPRSQVVELTNGCLCCTVQGQLATALSQLAGRAGSLDALIVEASGVADPGPVLRAFLAHDVRDAFAVRTLLTLVDATAPLPDLTFGAARQQVRFADRLAVTKTDQVPGSTLPRLQSLLRELNPHAPIENDNPSQPDLWQLLAHVADRPPASAEHHRNGGGHGFTSVAVGVDGPVDRAALDAWLAALLAAAEGRLARVKGIIALTGHDRRYVIQGVRDHITGEFAAPWRGARRSRLVFIGHRLDGAGLQAGLAACQTDQLDCAA